MKVLLIPREHIWAEVTDEQAERIRAAGATELVVTNDRERILAEIRDADALIGELDEEMFEHAGQLRWVQSLSSGVDSMLFPAFVESDVILTSEKGLVGPHLADHAFGLLLALTRSIAWAARQRRWDNRLPMRRASRELSRLTAGIVGFGGTGSEVARRAHGFGMRILAIDPDVTERPDYVEALSQPERLIEMASNADVLFVCCPLTRDTYHLIDGDVFDAMPERSYVINVTRGPIIDLEALMAALDSGKLAGAGLDVTEPEPLPDDSPLWGYDNVIITPHTAGASQYRVGRVQNRVIENIGRLSRGEPLEGVIDKRKGY
ncbi:MAG TPA: D-2-hydroxyacid dehydrogenase [Thermomicrobiales bacterium]|nr:D-2-hydroxyacid dehydrogenase [Thermomicrobiales bacterium]